jgi:hypothetical protein
LHESQRFSRQLTQLHRTELELSHSSQITILTENHPGHALQQIEIVHQERHKTISDTVKEIQNLQLSDLSDRRRSITSIREEYKKDKHSLRAQIESTITYYKECYTELHFARLS